MSAQSTPPSLKPEQTGYLKQVISLSKGLQVVSMLTAALFFLFIADAEFGLIPKGSGDPVAAAEADQEEKSTTTEAKVQTADIVDGKDAATGLVVDDHWQTVKSNCTGCHSAKLITQNRMSAKRWRKTIKWMQETQNLWDLGKNEDKIVAYLGKNYAPEDVGRRAPLTNVEWYELK